ncbi:MAG: hypothetical protein AABW68_03460, partial [archaeon]
MHSFSFSRSLGWVLFLGCLVLLPLWVSAQERGASDSLDSSSVPFDIAVLSPLDGERAEGTIVLLARPSTDRVSSITLRAGDTSILLTPDSHWSGSLDTSVFPDGDLSLEWESCVAERCVTARTTIRVDNPPVPSGDSPSPPSRSRKSRPRLRDAETLPPVQVKEEWFTLLPPSLSGYSVITAPSSRVPLARSSGSPISLPGGVYDASLHFFDAPLLSMDISRLVLDSNGYLARFRVNVPVSPFVYHGSAFEPISSLDVRLDYSTGSNTIHFPLDENSRFFYCSSFDSPSGSCSVSWLPAVREGDSLVVEWSGRSGLFVQVHRVESISSNPSSPISLADVPGEYFASSPFREMGPLDGNSHLFPHGEYDLLLHPFVGPLESISIDGASLDHPGTFLHVSSVGEEDPASLFIMDGNRVADSSTSSTSPIWVYSTDYPFSLGGWSLSPSISSTVLRRCPRWDANALSCSLPWEPVSSRSFTSPFVLQVIDPPLRDWNGDSLPFLADDSLVEAILLAKRLHSNKRFFRGVSLRDEFLALQQLSSNFEVSLECDSSLSSFSSPSSDAVALSLGSRSHDYPLSSVPSLFWDVSQDAFFSNAWEEYLPDLSRWRQRENFLSCDGISLSHAIERTRPLPESPSIIVLGDRLHDVKQSLVVRNDSGSSSTRLLGLRLEGFFDRVVFPSGSLHLSSWYQTHSPSSGDSILHLYDGDVFVGEYDLSDFVEAGFSPVVLVHHSGSVGVIETFLSVTLAPGEEQLLDPVYSLGSSVNYGARYSGGNASDSIGLTTTDAGINFKREPSPGFQLVNVDNGSYSNDLLIASPFADMGSRSNNGAVYLLRNIDLNRGSFDLNNVSNSSVHWYGPASGTLLGSSAFSGKGAFLADLDGNGYSNDLLLYSLNDFVAADAGSLYMILDIDSKSGAFDLNTASSFNGRWDGASTSEAFPNTLNTGSGVQVVDADNDSFPNDLLLTSAGGGTVFSGA